MPVVPFIPAIIGGAATVFGAHEAASGTADAAKTQADATNRALDITQQQYQQQRSDLGPYRAAGQGAVGQLSYLLGVPGFEGGATSHAAPPDAPTFAPNNVTQQQLDPGQQQALVSDALKNTPFPLQKDFLFQRAAAGNPYVAQGQAAAGGGQMVTVKAPNGSVGQIPANRLNDALAAGGQVVS